MIVTKEWLEEECIVEGNLFEVPDLINLFENPLDMAVKIAPNIPILIKLLRAVKIEKGSWAEYKN